MRLLFIAGSGFPLCAGAGTGCTTTLAPASIHGLRSASLVISISSRSTLITVDGTAVSGSVRAVEFALALKRKGGTTPYKFQDPETARECTYFVLTYPTDHGRILI